MGAYRVSDGRNQLTSFSYLAGACLLARRGAAIIVVTMKINMRTIQQALNIGQRIYREWNRYQNQKNREEGRGSSSQRRPDAGRGDFGTFGPGGTQQEPAGRSTGTSRRPAPSNPYATGYPAGSGAGASATSGGSWEQGGYPGDYFGSVAFDYSPALDGDADPGEVVWAWVPFEEDYSQGKDRPVLVIGRSGSYLLGLMLTSKDHSNSRTADPNYLDIGAGVWDREGRDSEVKLNRVIQLNPNGIRREGAIMDLATFDFIAEAYRRR